MSQALESALAIYNHPTRVVGPAQQAILGFGARFATGTVGMERAATGELGYHFVGPVSTPEAASVCPSLREVQSRLDATVARISNESSGLSPSQFGTAVHLDMQRQIQALKDPNFVAELSTLNGLPATYGTRGSVRVDILENVSIDKVCVYDIKTGLGGLSELRIRSLALESFKHFGKIPESIYITEVRPTR